MRNKLLFLLPLTVTFSFLNISCAHYFHRKHKHKKDSLAVIYPVNDSKVKGWVHFQKLENKQVLVRAKISGLEPNKKYGFHIHKYGDCRENGKNVGKHLSYDPDSPHGSPDSEEKHMGDMGNVKTGKKGVAVYKQALDICMRKIGGRSIIIHANEDDLKSQPSGNAGPYIGCGVIGYVKKSNKKAEIIKIKLKTKKEEPKKETEKPAKKEEPKKEQTTKIKKETKIIEIKEEKTTKVKQEIKKPKKEVKKPAKKEEPKKETEKPAKKEEPKKETEKPAKKEEPKKETEKPAE